MFPTIWGHGEDSPHESIWSSIWRLPRLRLDAEPRSWAEGAEESTMAPMAPTG